MEQPRNPSTVCGRFSQVRHAAATVPPRSLGALVLPGFQALSLWGPVEVLGDCAPAIQPLLTARSRDPVASAQGPRVQPEVLLDEAPRLDLLLVPGGNIARARHDDHLLEWLRDRSSDAEFVMAVGSGIELLAATGVLDGRRAVENTSFFSSTRGSNAVIRVERSTWVIDGRYVTCTGASAAVDMALDVVSRLLGGHAADQLATHL